MKKVRQIIQQGWRQTLMLFAVALLAAPAAVGAQSAGVGGRVANPDPSNSRTQSIFIYTLEHGVSQQDQLLVINQTDETQTISLRSVDGVVTNSGDYTCRQAAEPVEGSGGWVKLAQDTITLPAKSEERIDFTVTVPARADVGEHNSCLTIQADNDESDAATGVRLRMRQALRMIVTVPGDLRRSLSIEQFVIEQGVLDQRYTMTAANEGNVSADIDMQVRLTSVLGREVAGAGGEYPLVPGERLTKQFSTAYRPLFGGWYTATPSLRYDKRLGAFGTQNTAAEYETISGEPQTLFFWPTSAGWLILFAAVTCIVVGTWQLRRQLHLKRLLRDSARPYTVRKGDTIESLADKVQVDWRDIAKLNRLAAPYSLTPGQKILLPSVQDQRKESSSVRQKD